jgi:hypothetical protein
MTDKQTGGPAFPVPAELCQDLTVEQQRGMTLRDYFAAEALPVVMPDNRAYPMEAAKAAYRYADAMLKAREL